MSKRDLPSKLHERKGMGMQTVDTEPVLVGFVTNTEIARSKLISTDQPPPPPALCAYAAFLERTRESNQTRLKC